MSELNNANINGLGTVRGGEYNNVILSGSSKIIGDTKANKIVVSGICSSYDKLEANYIQISGMVKCGGELKSSKIIEVSGSAKAKFINANTLDISGTAKVFDSCFFEKGRISGKLNIGGSCEGRDFKASAKLIIGKLLSADIIDINIEGKSCINEIGGEIITIRKGRNPFGSSIFPILKKELTCELIEGDNIYIENTICKIVRGKNVVIADGCTIDKVEYTDSYKCDYKNCVKEVACIK